MEQTETRPNGATHTVSLLVENKPGVLYRVSGLFSRRHYNIASLTVGPTEVEGYSRITIVVRLGSKSVEQVVRQVQKLVPVVEVRELKPEDLIERELMLVKIHTPESNYAELRSLAETYDGAYGLYGRRAERAYITRTAYWTARLRWSLSLWSARTRASWLDAKKSSMR